MLIFNMGMGWNQQWSIQDHQWLKIEIQQHLLGLISTYRCPLQLKIPSSLCTTTTQRITLARSMASCIGRLWSLAIVACQNLGWTLVTSMGLVLKAYWGNVKGTKMSSDLTTTFDVPSFSHNVVTKWNTIVNWIHEMANLSTKNNGN